MPASSAASAERDEAIEDSPDREAEREALGAFNELLGIS